MNYFIPLLTFCIFAFAEYYPSRFQEGFTYSAEQTRLYSLPDPDAENVVSIPPGELIEIKEFTGNTLFSDSCSWGWYRAEYRLENSVYEGFILDQSLAFTSVSTGNDTILVFQLSSFNTVDNAFEGKISLIANGSILQSLGYQPNWTPYGRLFDYDVTLTLVDSGNMDNVKQLFIFYSGLDVSGLKDREDIIVLTDNNVLVEGPKAISIFVEDETKLVSEIILPSSSEGQINQITIPVTTYNFDENTESWIQIDKYSKIYQWQDNSFIETDYSL